MCAEQCAYERFFDEGEYPLLGKLVKEHAAEAFDVEELAAVKLVAVKLAAELSDTDERTVEMIAAGMFVGMLDARRCAVETMAAEGRAPEFAISGDRILFVPIASYQFVVSLEDSAEVLTLVVSLEDSAKVLAKVLARARSLAAIKWMRGVLLTRIIQKFARFLSSFSQYFVLHSKGWSENLILRNEMLLKSFRCLEVVEYQNVLLIKTHP